MSKLKIVLASIVLFSSFSLFAKENSQVTTLLKDIQETPLNLEFFRSGLLGAKEIEFQDFSRTNFGGSYRTFSNHLIVDNNLNDGLGNIKPFNKIATHELGELSHIAFYSFISNEVESSRSKKELKDWIRRRAKNYFTEVPRSYRKQVVETAYASFLGWVFSSYVSIQHSLSKDMTADQRERAIKLARVYWTSVWTSEIRGYYFKNGLLDYWSSLGQSSFEPIVVYKSIEDKDREWIAQNLLEARITSDFEKTFGTK